jgi:hypothetical protein
MVLSSSPNWPRFGGAFFLVAARLGRCYPGAHDHPPTPSQSHVLAPYREGPGVI